MKAISSTFGGSWSLRINVGQTDRPSTLDNVVAETRGGFVAAATFLMDNGKSDRAFSMENIESAWAEHVAQAEVNTYRRNKKGKQEFGGVRRVLMACDVHETLRRYPDSFGTIYLKDGAQIEFDCSMVFGGKL